MIYTQFYTVSALDNQKQIEACGDRSIIILDGRLSLKNKIKLSYQAMLLRGYNDFEIRKASNINRPFSILYKRLLKQ